MIKNCEAIYRLSGRLSHASVLTEFASKLAGILLGILRGLPLRRRGSGKRRRRLERGGAFPLLYILLLPALRGYP